MEKLKELKGILADKHLQDLFRKRCIYGLDYMREADFIITHLTSNRGMMDKFELQGNIHDIVRDLAYTGLTLDPSLNYAYITLREIDGKLCPQYEVGYQGMIARMAMLSDVFTLTCNVVYENCSFDLSFGTVDTLQHIPWYLHHEDSGKPIGAYVVIRYKNKESKIDYLTSKRIEQIRDNSIDGKKKDSPWYTSDWPEMWIKTVIKHAYKTIPKVPVGEDLMASLGMSVLVDKDNENHGYIDITSFDIPSKEQTADKKAIQMIETLKQSAQAAIAKGKPEKKKELAKEPEVADVKQEKPLSPIEIIDEMLTQKDGLDKLTGVMVDLGIYEDFLKRTTNQRLSKKMLHKELMNYLTKDDKKKQPKKETFSENKKAIKLAIEEAIEKHGSKGVKSYAKVVLSFIDMTLEPNMLPDGMRSEFVIDKLYELMGDFECADEVEKLLGDKDLTDITISELKKILT